MTLYQNLFVACVLVFAPITFSQVVVTGDVDPAPAASPMWSVGGPLTVGVTGTGTLEVSGGGVVSNTNGILGFVIGSDGTATVTGIDSQWINSGPLILGGFGTGTLNVADGGLVRASEVVMADSVSSFGILNLTGGTLSTGQLSEGAGLIGGKIIFDGGTLQLTGDQADLFMGFEFNDVRLEAGGGIFDTQGFNVASGLGLLGPGSLTKQGVGTLTLSGANIYTGATTVRNGTLKVTGSINHPGSDFTVGSLNGDDGSLEISGGGVVSNTSGTVGDFSGSTGTATVTGAGSQWNNSGSLSIGNFGNGTLNVKDGGRVSNTFGYVGDLSGSISTATVTGAGSQWTNSMSLFVGNNGTGTLTVKDGGVVSAEGVVVASEGSAAGTINLTGGTLSTGQVSEGDGTGGGKVIFNGGTLQLTGDQPDLFNGFEDYNVLISGPNGGTIDTQAFTVASGLGLASSGSLTKQGEGTLILTGTNTYNGGTTISKGTLQIGDGGTTGSITGDVTNNATLVFDRSDDISFDGVINGSGNLTKQGAGTLSLTHPLTLLNSSGSGNPFVVVREGIFDITGSINISEFGNLTAGHQSGEDGTVEIGGNGDVVTGEVWIGMLSGATGLVKVSGGASLDIDSLIVVGNYGDGTLEISGDGVVGNHLADIGNTLDATGVVKVSGRGSWTNSVLNLGAGGGNGRLEISENAVVNADITSIGSAADAVGTLTISGGTFTSTNFIDVGIAGEGTLDISGDGAVFTDATLIALNSGSTGVVTVRGGTFTHYVDLDVGYQGEGRLEISGTGSVLSPGAAIASFSGSTGIVKVSGGSWTNSGVLNLGAGGNGTLEISGGTVSSESIMFAGFHDSAFGTLDLLGGMLSTGQVGNGIGEGKVFFDGGTLQLTGDQANLFDGFGTGDVTFDAGGAFIDSNGFDIGTSVVIDGTGGLTKLGAGTLTLGGANTYTGMTTVTDGILDVTGGIDSAVITVQDTASLHVAGSNLTGLPALTLNGSGNFSLYGHEGIGSLASSSPTSTVDMRSYSLVIRNEEDTLFAGVLSGTGHLEKSGSGTLTLSGESPFSGEVYFKNGILDITGSIAAENFTAFLSDGILQVDGNSILDTAEVDLSNAGGTLRLTGNEKIGSLNGEATTKVELGANTLSIGKELTIDRFYGEISGTGGLTILTEPLDTYTFELRGTNTFTGDTRIEDGGSLEFYGGSALADTSDVILTGGNLVVYDDETIGAISGTSGTISIYNTELTSTGNGGTREFAGILSGSGTSTFTKDGTDILTLSSIVSLPTINVNSGTLILSHHFNTIDNIYLDDGILRLESNGSAGGSAGLITTTGSLIDYADGIDMATPINLDSNTTQFQVLSGSATQSGIISETGGARPLEKIGTGVLTLSGNNSYSGGTTLSAGTLIIGHNNALGTGGLTIGAGTTLEGDDPRRITNDMVATGDFSVAPRNTFPTISALELDGNLDLGDSTRSITNTLDFASFEIGQVNFGGVISGDAGVGLNLRDNGSLPGGNLVFFRFDGSGANTYDGSTSVGSNVSLALGKTAGVNAIAGDVSVEAEAVVVVLNSEQIADSSSVQLNGTGQLQVGVDSSVPVTETIATLLDDGSGDAVVELAGDGSTGSTLVLSSGDFSGEIKGGGTSASSLVKNGSGTLILSGENTYTGGSTVTGGTLLANNASGSATGTGDVTVATTATLGGTGNIGGNVTVQSGATLAPGASIGVLKVGGNSTFESGSFLTLEGNGNSFDRLDVTGMASIASGAYISFDLGATPLSETNYTLLTASGGLLDSTPFTLSGLLPSGYILDYTGTALNLVQQAIIDTITATPDDGTIITGGSTDVAVTVGNGAESGSADLDATVTGDGGDLNGSGTVTVAPGNTGSVDPDLVFTGSTTGTGQTGTVTVTDPNAINNPQTGTVTVDVLDHAAPDLSIASGNNQNVIVGAGGITAELALANGTSGESNLSPMDVANLSSGLSGATGSGVIASGDSGSYIASLDTATVGAAQTQNFSLDAGDQQTLAGADALSNQEVDVTLNVFGHADPSISGTTFDFGNVHVGYGTSIVSNTESVTNGTAGDYIVDLKSDGVTSGNLSVNSISGVAAGDSTNIAATLATGQGVGTLAQTLTYTFADDSALAGASSDLGSESLNITGQVYSGQAVWNVPGGGSWGTFASGFGDNWQTGGGSPGLDAGFVDIDTGTFGVVGSGTVTLDGATPSLNAITFDNTIDSYEIATGSGGSISLNGGAGQASVQNLAGNHRISAPLMLTTDTRFSSANMGDTLRVSGAIGGAGNVEIGGAGRTVFTQDQSYAGSTTVSSGTMVSQNLPNSAVLLTGGIFSPGDVGTVSSIAVDSLALDGGSLNYDFATPGTSDFIASSGIVALNAPTEFTFNDAGFAKGVFSLINGGLTGFDDLSGLSLNTGTTGLQGLFGVDAGTLFLRIYDEDTVLTGPVLSNAAPYLIPVTANFLVSGAVTTWPLDAGNTVNSLAFAPGSSLQVFNELTVTSGDFTVDGGSAVINGGTLTTPGSFAKRGAGILTINSDINAGGPAGVFDGSLHVNRVFNVPAELTVYRNAELGGTGLIRGEVFNDGTVAPGNSIGTLTVDGNYSQSSAGTLEVEYANASHLDHLNVTGTATLDGTLKMIKTGSGVAYGDKANILTAQVGIIGRFSKITGLPGGVRARQLIGSTMLSLLFAPSSYTLVAEGANQTAVAAALDSWLGSSNREYTAATLQLDHLRETQYPAVFESMLPHLYPVLAERGLTDGYNDGRSVTSQALAARWLPRPDAESDRKGWRVWTDLRGGYANTDVFSMDEEDGALLVGMDQQVGGAVFGFYLGGQDFDSDTGADVSYEGEGMRYGIYGSLAVAEAGYISLVAGGGQTNYDSKRPLPFGESATASPEASDWFTRVEAGWRIDLGLTLTPFVGLQYSKSTLEAFTEESDSVYALAMDESEVERSEGYAGLDVSKTFPAKDAATVLRPYARVLLRSDFSDEPDALRVRLDQGNSSSFDYQSEQVKTDGIETGAGIAWSNLETGWGVNIGYTGFFGDDQESHLVNMGISYGR